MCIKVGQNTYNVSSQFQQRLQAATANNDISDQEMVELEGSVQGANSEDAKALDDIKKAKNPDGGNQGSISRVSIDTNTADGIAPVAVTFNRRQFNFAVTANTTNTETTTGSPASPSTPEARRDSTTIVGARVEGTIGTINYNAQGSNISTTRGATNTNSTNFEVNINNSTSTQENLQRNLQGQMQKLGRD
ncbi:MAG: hypothetical protein U0457_06010 [Candidatus Sericytochromatia bacterium]